MDFTKYNSIENSYQSRFVEKSIYNLDGYNDFIVQEKIHWANFAFYVTADGIKCAKRTGFIWEDESFFDYKSVLEKYEYSCKALQKEIWRDIIIFGEIFGGWVQKEVWYKDSKDFYAFDIQIDWMYISTDEANKYFEKYNFLYAKTLMRWTLEECFTYDVNKNSVVAETELPKYLNWVNTMEGVVIRPNITKFFGNSTLDSSRIIFKKKTEWFSERKAPDKIPSNPLKYSLYDEYITKPRLTGIISKYGEITDKKDLMKFWWYLVKDIIEDYEKDNWESDEWVSKYLHTKCIKFILQELF